MNLNPKFLKSIEQITKPKNERSKNRIYAMLICFCISLSIWFMIKMSKDYYSDIQFPIQYISTLKGQTLTNIQDTTISLKIQSRGFSLFNAKYLKDKDAFNISLRNIEIHSNRYSMGHYILTSDIGSQIRTQIDDAENVVSISPDTLFFHLENINTKEVPLQFNLDFTTAQQYGIYGSIDYFMDTILITGPPSIIDTIQVIHTEKIKLDDLKETVQLKMALIKPKSDNISLSHDSAEVRIPVEQFTENIIKVPININSTEDLKLRLFPNEVSITCLVALKDFQTMNPQMFEAQIVFNPNRQRTQKVELNKYPSFVKINRIEPEIVEYIILK